MKKVWLAQCLCPDRHAILAAAGEAEDLAGATIMVLQPLQGYVTMLLAAGKLNPWCGLCNAPPDKWSCEVAGTEFATMAEAAPTLLKEQAQQIATNLMFGDLHKGTKQ